MVGNFQPIGASKRLRVDVGEHVTTKLLDTDPFNSADARTAGYINWDPSRLNR